MSMPDTVRDTSLWDSLHAQKRFRPMYPHEEVVRFLARRAGASDAATPRALDIGVGAGRHCVLLSTFGYAVDGVDISAEGLRHARDLISQNGGTASLQQGTMSSLPFEDGVFDLVLSVGVFYYGTAEEGRLAIAELFRVLKPGGEAFVVSRTTRDHRYGRGAPLGDDTFRLEIEETNECGTVQHFLSERAVETAFGAFSELHFELSETTFGERRSRNSDWLIAVRK